MARIRTIKPELFKHLELQELENSHAGQYIMLVFIGLWTQCDKNGVFIYNAKVLKNEILPFIDFDMQITLDILEKGGYFTKFQHDNREYGHVVNFNKYQFPGMAEKKAPAKYPEPPIKSTFENNTKTALEPSQNGFETVPSTFENNTDPEGEMIKDKRKKECSSSGEPPESFLQALELSTLLLTSHRKEFTDYLSGKDIKKTTKDWANDIEKLIRIDKKPPETIRKVILWVKEPGNFWFHNIESGAKLRKQFERLHGEMLTKAQPKKTDPPERMGYILSAEESDRMLAERNGIERYEGGSFEDEYKKMAREKQEVV
jgi:hypothetical protein